ncbi:MAG TPA: Hsp33 family molecular chaperone HslO [Rhodocyclaceae bacterium]|nr:Hsp33 family molecular chaperone HslO [Rhodocyclaceae bacterium]
MSDSTVHRFLFEHLDIRGAVVRLGDCWRQMQADRGYAAPVAQVLGEMAAVTALIAAQLKQAGRLTFQLRSDGPINLLVIDCNEALQMRGMARADALIPEHASAVDLLGGAEGGQLLLSLDFPEARQPWQSIVPMVGDSIAAIFEHYLEKSEQQPSRLYLAANAETAACLFLQKLPQADAHDADGWNRVQQLAATATAEELCTLPAEALLTRLYHEDTVRLYDPSTVVYHCPEDREKIRGMILSLGRQEAEHILEEHGEIVVKDDICNREYRFDAREIAELFDGHTLH